ncbi:MAG TPA: tetratricopeptide repeat protein [Pirellulales bacterium]|nr:tetratricopeptide repeat protein [Pirellulales bacterium]
MRASSARSWAEGPRLGVRLIGCAAAVWFLGALTAQTSSEESGETSASKQPDAGKAVGPALRPVGPVVGVAPQREPQAEPQPTSTEPAHEAGTAMASDSDDALAANKEPRRETKPLSKPLADGSAVLSDETKPAVKSVLPPDGLAFKGIEDLPPLPALAIDPAAFKGITPGASTIDDLLKLWGDGVAASGKEGEARWIYKIEPYRRVQVTMAGRRVASISVRLEKPFEPEILAKQLHLDAIVPVPVLDETGQPLGESFPERGILFSYAPETKLVTQMLLEPIDAEPFVMRAAADSDAQVRRSLRDLDYALELDPKSARAHWLRAQVLAGMGRFQDALKSIDEALRLDPKQPPCLLSKADILGHLDRHSDGIMIAKQVLGDAKLPSLVKAQALNTLADLTAEGPDHDYKQAIELHLSAIKTAGELAADRRAGVRREAKRVLVEAHLGAASDIAFGVWQQKEQIAARWITRADELAKNMIETEQAADDLRLHVARRALDARVGIQGKWDSSDWTARVLESATKLIDAAGDPLHRQRLEWELGLALFDVGQLDQLHGLSDHSLADGTVDLTYLQEGAKHRQQTADDAYLFGRLYAHLGIVHATQEKNHAVAVTCFDKAVPLLDRPLPLSALPNLGRHGESFVAMGISYWEAGQRDEGLRLTQKGVDLMAKAVSAKSLDERALAIPYGNLAAMHRQLGHSDEARSFADLASRLDGPNRR